MKKIIVVVETCEHNLSAYLRDVDGIIATGATIEEIKECMTKSIELHKELCEEEGFPVPDLLHGECEFVYKFDYEFSMCAIVEKGNDGGFSIYSKEDEHIYGYGLTIEEAKVDFEEVVKEQADYYKEKNGCYPDWYEDGIVINYQYDFSAFFEAFPFINASAFAKALGINTSLMRKYKSKLAFPSVAKMAEVQSKYNDILKAMQSVQF